MKRMLVTGNFPKFTHMNMHFFKMQRNNLFNCTITMLLCGPDFLPSFLQSDLSKMNSVPTSTAQPSSSARSACHIAEIFYSICRHRPGISPSSNKNIRQTRSQNQNLEDNVRRTYAYARTMDPNTL